MVGVHATYPRGAVPLAADSVLFLDEVIARIGAICRRTRKLVLLRVGESLRCRDVAL